MITLSLESNGKIPLYEQLYLHIRKEIENGNIKPGEKLPSKRGLASHLKISVVTVETAYAQLLSEGYIYSRPGSGFFAETISGKISAARKVEIFIPSRVKEEEYKYDFGTNRVDTGLFPFSAWAKLSREVLSAGGEELLCRDKVYGLENPGYVKTHKIFNANCSAISAIPVNEYGADPAAMEVAQADVVHITPSHQFPLGTIMPIARRHEILNWAYGSPCRYIIEDDYDSDFYFSGRPVPSLQSMDTMGRVIYINTFTKSLAPSMRISYMVLPSELLEQFTNKLGFYACTVPVFEQLTLSEFMKRGYFDRHINRMKKLYKSRRDWFIECVNKSSLSGHIEIKGAAAGPHGVRVYGLSEYYSFGEKNIPEGNVIVGYSGINFDDIEKGVCALEKAWV